MTWKPALPINFSRLKHIDVSPLQFKYDCNNPWVASSAAMTGTAAHILSLEPENEAELLAVWPKKSLAKSKALEEFRDANSSKLVISQAQHDAARGIRDALQTHPVSRELLTGGQNELKMFWTDPITGIECRGTVDKLTTRVVDLKVSGIEGGEHFAAKAIKMLYHSQVCWYEFGAKQNGHTIQQRPAIIHAGMRPPHDITVLELGKQAYREGNIIWRRCINKLSGCLKTGEWPGANPKAITLKVPSYLIRTTEADLQ